MTDKQLTDREIKALQIAAKHKLTRKGKQGFTLKEVSADKGYLGVSNMLARLQRGAIPKRYGDV